MTRPPHSADSSDRGEPTDPYERLESVLSSLLGPQAAHDAIEMMRASGIDPAAMAASGMMPDLDSLTPSQVMAMQAQMQQVMASMRAPSPDGVNWQIGEQVAHQVAAQGGDPVVTAGAAEAARKALSVADLWLDAVTELDPAPGQRQAWTRSQWVDRTLETWKEVCAPVAQGVVAALSDALRQQADNLPQDSDLPRQLGSLGGVVQSLAGSVFGAQVGHAVGELARQAVFATDSGLPLSREPGTALVPAGIEAFAEGLEGGVDQVRMFLAVREAATARLYARVPWLRSQVLEAVRTYASHIRVDTEAIERAVAQADPTDPEALRTAMENGVFMPTPSREQVQARERLETLLALIEGWVEVVSAQALAPHIPEAIALGEMWRRRRLEGGSADQVLATLIGLEFRPRRVREAVRLWTLLGQQEGAAGREDLWRHPDLMPTAADLDAPEDFLTLRQAQADLEQDIDADLARLLDGTLGYAGDAREADGAPGRDDSSGSPATAGSGTPDKSESAGGPDEPDGPDGPDEPDGSDGPDEPDGLGGPTDSGESSGPGEPGGSDSVSS